MPLSNQHQASHSIYDYSVTAIDGKIFDFKSLKGKKIIIVNTASECGNTPQYAELEKIYEQYKTKNLVIIGFPSNDFGKQEPGTNDEIHTFCSLNYKVTFPMMSKTVVKGNDMAPLFKWLTQKKLNGIQDAPITWNFQKFLINEKGEWVASIAPQIKPLESQELLTFISK